MVSPPQSVEQLFLAALECGPEDRRAFLDRACRDSPDVRWLVEQRLLAAVPPSDPAANRAEEGSATDSHPLPGDLDFGGIGRFPPGQLIAERFTVIRFIARGGMGEVYEVEDRFLQGVHVALKVILPAIAGDEDFSRRFEQEVLLARKITHPNLCPIYDIARCDRPAPPFLFLTMKLLAGESLSARLRRPQALVREEVTAIFRQMIAGLSAIHAAGVIHRDIKPNNVMLDSSGPELCLSIMDFGLARLHEPDATMPTLSLVAGTPGYMAPEILKGQGPSQATDLFALGVLLHQVLTRERPRFGALSLSVEPYPALDTADVPPVFIHTVKEFLSGDPERRCVAFEQIQSALASTREMTAWTPGRVLDSSAPRALTRRQFAIGSAVMAFAGAGGIAWKWDRLYDVLHPLPDKRFVALLAWPPQADPSLKPMVLGVIDTIAGELERAEAFDRNLLVIAQRTTSNLTTTVQLNEARESLGANLVLAASGARRAKDFVLTLRVLNSSPADPLRKREVSVPLTQAQSLPQKAVLAAAELLGIAKYGPDDQQNKVATTSPEAYAAFQDAEALMKQPNDTGLESATEKYKQAIELDPRYAAAQARIAWAYLRSYALHRQPAALSLARANCESSILIDPNSIDAHLAFALVYEQTGNRDNAAGEMSRALSLDPLDSHTLVYQARFYADNRHRDDAEETFSRLLKLRPNYWLAHLEHGVFLDNQGKYFDALAEFQSARILAPKNALPLSNIGWIYIQQGELSQAIEYLRASFALQPNEAAATNLAEVSRVQRHYSEAVAYAQTAVKLNPSRADAQLKLGDCLSAAGSHKQAAAAYTKATRLVEEQLATQTRDGSGWMFLALCRVKTGDSASAGLLIVKAESLGADDVYSQLVKVRTLELLSRRVDSLAAISALRSRGATAFQFQTMPDLDALRTDPRYQQILEKNTLTTKQAV